MDAKITKKDDNTIEVVKTMPVAVLFTPEYLKEQRAAVIKQRDEEIAEIDMYLAEMEKLWVCDKCIVSEVVEEEIEPISEDVKEELIIEEKEEIL